MTFVQIFTTLVNLTLLVMILGFLRRETLKEKYSLLWFAAILVVQAFLLPGRLLDHLAAWAGIYYPPSLLFFLALLFLFAILLHLSLVISRLHHQNQVLAQRLALLESRLESPPSPRN